MDSTKYSDCQLFENIVRNDYASYNHIFLRYYSRLCLFVTSITNSVEDSEDIVQELFIKLWANRGKIEIRDTVAGYLFQAAKNMAINHIRSETSRKVAIGKLQQDYLFTDIDDVEYEEFDMALQDCVDQLPARNKEILLMHRMQGYKQKEIAEKLQISVQTIKNQIGISLQRLKKCLEIKGLL